MIKMNRQEELYQVAERCAKILTNKYKAKRVFLIGSIVKGIVHDRSDIDMVVEGLPSELYIKALTELWGYLPPGEELNLIPFENAFESLKQKVINEGELLYG